jgi:hypothetical protein
MTEASHRRAKSDGAGGATSPGPEPPKASVAAGAMGGATVARSAVCAPSGSAGETAPSLAEPSSREEVRVVKEVEAAEMGDTQCTHSAAAAAALPPATPTQPGPPLAAAGAGDGADDGGADEIVGNTPRAVAPSGSAAAEAAIPPSPGLPSGTPTSAIGAPAGSGTPRNGKAVKYVDTLLARAKREKIPDEDARQALNYFEAAKQSNAIEDYKAACSYFETCARRAARPSIMHVHVHVIQRHVRSAAPPPARVHTRHLPHHADTVAPADVRHPTRPLPCLPPPFRVRRRSFLLNPKLTTLISTANMHLKLRNPAVAAEIYMRLLQKYAAASLCAPARALTASRECEPRPPHWPASWREHVERSADAACACIVCARDSPSVPQREREVALRKLAMCETLLGGAEAGAPQAF